MLQEGNDDRTVYSRLFAWCSTWYSSYVASSWEGHNEGGVEMYLTKDMMRKGIEVCKAIPEGYRVLVTMRRAKYLLKKYPDSIKQIGWTPSPLIDTTSH